eukprot:scaffold27385_cov47-Attheya_sp.AAC.2
MPTRVTFWVQQGSSLPVHERHPITKKQRTTNVPSIRRKSEIATTVQEVTVKTEEIDDGSTVAGDDGLSENVLCELSYDPHLSHKPITSSNTSKQCTSQFNDEICSFKGSLESDIDTLSNQDSRSRPLNNGFSELQCEEDLEYKEVAQSSITHEPSDTISAWNHDSKRKRPTWDQRFQELVDFKKINGHTSVPQLSGQLGGWVQTQRTQYRLFQEGKDSTLTNERRKKLEGIGFAFAAWDQRFQELVDFKKMNGHTKVPQLSGQLGTWVVTQRQAFRRLEEGLASPLINERREKLEGIGFVFVYRPTAWDQRFQELVDFKKINGHTKVPTGSGQLGRWVDTQRRAFRRLKEGKYSPLINERREKLKGIGFRFIINKRSRTLK